MHKNDREIRSLFGKLYVWGETPGGSLMLISVARLTELMARVPESADA